MNKTFKIIIPLILIAFIASVPYWTDSASKTVGQRLETPSKAHWLGTDRIGRDVAARTIAGLSFTLAKALAVLLGSLLIGIPIAVISVRSFGGFPDKSIAFVAEVIRSLPFIVLLLLCLTLKIPGIPVFIFYYWIPVWRLCRGAMAPQRNAPYLMSANLFGFSKTRGIIAELFPNIWPNIYNNLPALLADIIAVLAALEFLGVGSDIGQPSLGGMLLDSIQLGFSAPWSWVPSLIILIIFIWGLTMCSHSLQRKQEWTPLG